jgi:hypothetical protein
LSAPTFPTGQYPPAELVKINLAREHQQLASMSFSPRRAASTNHHEPGDLGQDVVPAVGNLAQSSIDASKIRHRTESYGWSRLTSLANVLSSPLLFCS